MAPLGLLARDSVCVYLGINKPVKTLGGETTWERWTHCGRLLMPVNGFSAS